MLMLLLLLLLLLLIPTERYAVAEEAPAVSVAGRDPVRRFQEVVGEGRPPRQVRVGILGRAAVGHAARIGGLAFFFIGMARTRE